MTTPGQPALQLPPGVQKEILREAPPENTRIAAAGDEVSVHYVGRLLSDGSEFDSSRQQTRPFIFTIGRREVIKGWDFGVSTMKKGELSKFTMEPAFCYGPQGKPPMIPPNAVLVFEIELLGWISDSDVFGDEGVQKIVIKEGYGSTSPKLGDEVLISLKATSDGMVVEEKRQLEYTIGSEALEPIGKICDMMLCDMTRGEEICLELSQTYAYGERTPEGANVALVLHEIFQTQDVSPLKNGVISKKRVREGEGDDVPGEGSLVTLLVESATDGANSVPSFSPKKVTFTVGDGEVCDVLEWVVVEMKKFEVAVITVTNAEHIVDDELGLGSLNLPLCIIRVKLQDFSRATDIYNLNQVEAVEWGAKRKDVGAKLFKSQRFRLALQTYTRLADLFTSVDRFHGENKAKATELHKLCSLNKAACFLKLNDYKEAKSVCGKVLEMNSKEIKAIYRRAQAHFGLSEIGECIRDCKRVLELDSRNRDAMDLLKQALACQKEEDRQSKGMYVTMCKALGKTKIPEPPKHSFEDEVPDDDMHSFFDNNFEQT